MAILTGAMLCAAVWFYTVDDAYITYRYARNLIAGHGPVFNVGQRVEGYSSPLWVAASAAAASVGLPQDQACKGVGVLVLAVLLFQVSRRLRRLAPTAQWPLLLLATHSPLIVGLVSGLETGVNAALIVGLLLSAHRAVESQQSAVSWRGLAVLGGLAILCRPENGLLVGVHGLYLWSARPAERRRLYATAAIWLAVAAALTLARRFYYSAWVPNTAVAKFSADCVFGSAAWYYLRTWLAQYGWLALAALPAFFARQTRGLAANAGFLIAAQVVFVFLSGGDWMQQWRFLLPAGVILLVLTCYGVHVAAAFVGSPRPSILSHRYARPAGALVLILGLGAGVVTQLWHFRHDRWVLDYYRRQLGALAAGPMDYLSRRARPTDTVVARDVGVLGYVVDCRVLDVVGLTDPHVAVTSGMRHRERIDLDYVFGGQPRYLLLQSGKERAEPTPFDPVAAAIRRDQRFCAYRLRGRWDLPGRHFCEIYERIPGDEVERAALIAADE